MSMEMGFLGDSPAKVDIKNVLRLLSETNKHTAKG